jgi:hypothetical protein
MASVEKPEVVISTPFYARKPSRLPANAWTTVVRQSLSMISVVGAVDRRPGGG